MRKEVPEIGWGRFFVLPCDNPAILLLRYEWRNNAVLFVHNLGDEPIELSFPAQASHDRSGLLVNLLSEDHSVAGTDGQTPPAARALRVPLVPCRRTRLPAPAQRGLIREHLALGYDEYAVEIVRCCVWNPGNLRGVCRATWFRRRDPADSLDSLNCFSFG